MAALIHFESAFSASVIGGKLPDWRECSYHLVFHVVGEMKPKLEYSENLQNPEYLDGEQEQCY